MCPNSRKAVPRTRHYYYSSETALSPVLCAMSVLAIESAIEGHPPTQKAKDQHQTRHQGVPAGTHYASTTRPRRNPASGRSGSAKGISMDPRMRAASGSRLRLPVAGYRGSDGGGRHHYTRLNPGPGSLPRSDFHMMPILYITVFLPCDAQRRSHREWHQGRVTSPAQLKGIRWRKKRRTPASVLSQKRRGSRRCR